MRKSCIVFAGLFVSSVSLWPYGTDADEGWFIRPRVFSCSDFLQFEIVKNRPGVNIEFPATASDQFVAEYFESTGWLEGFLSGYLVRDGNNADRLFHGRGLPTLLPVIFSYCHEHPSANLSQAATALHGIAVDASRN
jgi:hypothetical protein